MVRIFVRLRKEHQTEKNEKGIPISLSWMQRHVAAGGGWGVGAQPLPILPGQCRREVSKGDEREALSFGRWGQGRRRASPAWPDRRGCALLSDFTLLEQMQNRGFALLHFQR